MNPEPQAGGNNEVKPGESVSPQQGQPVANPTAEQTAAPSPYQLPGEESLPAPDNAPAEERHFFSDDSSTSDDTYPDAGALATSSFSASDPQQADLRMQHVGEEVAWTASEFIAHEKSFDWYLRFAAVAVVVLFIAGLISRDVITIVIVAAVLALFGFTASRKPRQMRYAVDEHGVSIGSRHFKYDDFRGFSIIHEGALQSITFMPLKRFMPPLNIYFDPGDEHRIVDVLADHLPIEQPRHDPIDNFMRRIRF